MAEPLARRKFTAEEYHRLAEAGILKEDDRVELIEGEIVEMSPIGPRHAGAVNRLLSLFMSLQARGLALISVQNPLRLGGFGEPQPDLVLLKPREDFYASSHPSPEDALLVVEVAEASLEYDRQVKLPLYARWGVQEVWLLDLLGDRLEVHRDPSPEGYRQTQVLSRGNRVVPSAFPGLVLEVADLLG